MKYTDIFLVDCENVGTMDYAKFPRTAYVVWFIRGNQTKKIASAPNERVYNLTGVPKQHDAMDFAINMLLGWFVNECGADAVYHIISKDSGYTVSQHLLRAQGYTVTLSDNFYNAVKWSNIREYTTAMDMENVLSGFESLELPSSIRSACNIVYGSWRTGVNHSYSELLRKLQSEPMLVANRYSCEQISVVADFMWLYGEIHKSRDFADIQRQVYAIDEVVRGEVKTPLLDSMCDYDRDKCINLYKAFYLKGDVTVKRMLGECEFKRYEKHKGWATRCLTELKSLMIGKVTYLDTLVESDRKKFLNVYKSYSTSRSDAMKSAMFRCKFEEPKKVKEIYDHLIKELEGVV